jgi:hypothetical protein
LLGSIGSDGTLYGASTPIKKVDGVTQLFTLTKSASGYQFSLGDAVYTGARYDAPASGPQPWLQGAMVGATQLGLYFTSGSLVYTYVPPDTSTEFGGPLTVAPDGTIYGAGVYYGAAGSIYSFSAAK